MSTTVKHILLDLLVEYHYVPSSKLLNSIPFTIHSTLKESFASEASNMFINWCRKQWIWGYRSFRIPKMDSDQLNITFFYTLAVTFWYPNFDSVSILFWNKPPVFMRGDLIIVTIPIAHCNTPC